MAERPTFVGSDSRVAKLEPGDPWRRRMRKAADRLRLLDADRFEDQIERIERCLDRDARWDLTLALESCDRWRGAE
jgi:hypothetical protein